MSIYMTAAFQVKPESVQKCRDAIAEFVTHIRANEPGTRLYMALQEDQDPTRFLHVFWFESEEAQQVHRSSDAVQRFTSILYPETVDGVAFTTWQLVAANRD